MKQRIEKMEPMKRFAQKVIQYRWLIIILFIAITLFFAAQIPRAEIVTDVKKMLPEDMSSRLVLDKIEEIFGGTEMAMIIICSDDVLEKKILERVKKISKRTSRVKGVDKVLSLFDLKEIIGTAGTMIVNPAVKKIPQDKEQKEALRQRLKDNDVVYGSVVSKDFKATAVIAQLKIDVSDAYITKKLRQIVKEVPGDEPVIFGGVPFTRESASEDIRTDFQKLLPIGILIMLIFLFVCFRQLRGVMLPFLVVIMSILVGMGLIPLLGWKIQIVTVLLPIILVAVANDYGIHLISNYQENNKEGSTFTKHQLASRGIQTLGKPIITTGITTVAGMMCLQAHIIVPAKQLGLLAAFGIFFALTASLFLIPALLSLLPKGKPVIKEDIKKSPIMDRLLNQLSTMIPSKAKPIAIVFAIVTILLIAGIPLIKVETNPVTYYSKGHPIFDSAQMVNEKFGGVNAISVVAEGDIKDPTVLKKIDDFENQLNRMPEIGATLSLGRVVRQMTRAIHHKDEPGYNKIPQTRDAVAQYLELYSMSGDPEDFEKMVDFPYRAAQITAQIKSESTTVIKKVVEKIEEKIDNEPVFTMAGGFATVYSQLVDEVIKGQLISLLLSIGVVAVLVMILFRSLGAGLISVLPLGLSLVLLFGLMGYAGIELNFATALLSSIMVGVGIDYTIHFLWRYRKERSRGLNSVKAVQRTFKTVGRGIIFNAFSVVVGFIVLLLSNFLPIKFFGFLIVLSISTCLVGALVVLPSICIVFKPKFLEPHINK
ncbi:MAG: RND family transporter [Candidatus Aminicenantes bacterium]|nr:MAG: RND family transporter [Candidatus Aminicenantes bacterium]